MKHHCELTVAYLKKYQSKDDVVHTQVKQLLNELVQTCLDLKIPEKDHKFVQETVSKLNSNEINPNFQKFFDMECKVNFFDKKFSF